MRERTASVFGLFLSRAAYRYMDTLTTRVMCCARTGFATAMGCGGRGKGTSSKGINKAKGKGQKAGGKGGSKGGGMQSQEVAEAVRPFGGAGQAVLGRFPTQGWVWDLHGV